MQTGACLRAGLVRVQPVRVEHCADAWALVLASQAGECALW